VPTSKVQNGHVSVIVAGSVAGILFFGGVAAFLALAFTMHAFTGNDPFSYCTSHAPPSFSYDGETPPVAYNWSWSPFGLTCRYGEVNGTVTFFEFGPPFAILGLAGLLGAVVATGLWAWFFVRSFVKRG
jgi:hypothetical protein